MVGAAVGRVALFSIHPRYARAKRGRIGIQEHGGLIAFRAIRVRVL